MEITLNPNGWHRRLQKWVFGRHTPDYYNFCPYFWLTNFCIFFTFLVPIIPVIKFLAWLFGAIGASIESAGEWMDKNICKPRFEYKVSTMTEDDIMFGWYFSARRGSGGWYENMDTEDYLYWAELYGDKFDKLDSYRGSAYKKSRALMDKLDAWKEKNPNWKQLIKEYQAKRLAGREAYMKQLAEDRAKQLAYNQMKEERAARAQARRQAFFSFIAKHTKWLFWLFISALAIWIVSLLYRLGIYIYEHFYWDKFVVVMKWVGVILGCVVVGILTIYGLVKLIQKAFCNIDVTESKFFKGLVWFFGKIGDGIVAGAEAVGKFFSFFWEYIVAAKKDYCPAINWKEDSHAKD